jgi:hypothetical protein
MIPVVDAADFLAGKSGGPGNPPKWDAISYEDWITWWTSENYDPKRQADVAA